MTPCTHQPCAVCWRCSDQVSWWREARIRAGLGAEPPNAPSEAYRHAIPSIRVEVVEEALPALTSLEWSILDTIQAVIDDCEEEGLAISDLVDAFDEREEAITAAFHSLNKAGFLGYYTDTKEWALGTKGRAVLAAWRKKTA